MGRNPFSLSQPAVSKVLLNMQRICSEIRVSMACIERAELTEHVDDQLKAMVYRLSTYVATDKFAEDSYSTTLEVPATWWDHFKHTYADRWWLRRYVKKHPVKTSRHRATVKVERMHSYPDCRINMPDMGRPFILEMASRPDWDRPFMGDRTAARARD